MKEFGWKGKPGTCLWCGKKLPPKSSKTTWENTGEYNPPAECYACHVDTIVGDWEEAPGEGEGVFKHRSCGTTWHGRERKRVVSRDVSDLPGGYMNSGAFCTASCGFDFGLKLARSGIRLELRDGKMVWSKGNKS